MYYIRVLVVLSVVAFGHCVERILGGSDASRGFAPHQVSLKISGRHTCGGSILNEHWILTAAHCTDQCRTQECTIEYGTTIHGQGMTAKLDWIYDHPQYLPNNGLLNDISLLKVSGALQLGGKAKAIRLNRRVVPAGKQGVVTGWGDTTGYGHLPNRLKIASISVVRCDIPPAISHLFVCLQSNDSSPCRGDSGGPLVVDNALAGVSSSVRHELCLPSHGATYTRISTYIPWIQSVTGIA